MVSSISLISAWAAGLLGAVHCIGMCGGIMATLTLGCADQVKLGRYLLLYNGGRLISYMLVGAIVGFLGASLGELTGLHHSRQVMALIAGSIMILIGLYLSGLWKGLIYIERVGAWLWHYLSPWGERLLPIRSASHALILGVIWGWLPCGLVYTILLWALTTGKALDGMLLMLSFGVGTLPVMLLVGHFAGWLRPNLQLPLIRLGAGITVILLGVYTMISPKIGG